MGGWFLVVCVSHGLICNVLIQMEFFDEADCRAHLEAIVEANSHVTYAECVELK